MSNTILLIEDNVQMRENIAEILQLSHYHVLTAENGKIGVNIAQSELPDIILCDVMMPELDGYGVVHILKSDPTTASIPFIFLTAKSDKRDFRDGMNLGADDYITKPFEGVDLLKVVEVQLKKRNLIRSALENPDDKSLQRKGADIKELIKDGPNRTFKKKQFIFMNGQSSNDLFYINKGSVKTFKINYDGKELITGIHQPGEFLGYVPLLENRPYGENAETLEESSITIISKPDFLDLVYSNKEVAQKFLTMLSIDLEETENRLLDVAYQSVRQRVAKALIKIHDQFAKPGDNSLISISRKDISNIVGTATESLNRTLADFRDEGLISIAEDGLRIINRPKLERVLH